MTMFATSLLLAGSFFLSEPGHLEPNAMLRDAAVDHDMAKVKRQFERTLHGKTEGGREGVTFALPPIAP